MSGPTRALVAAVLLLTFGAGMAAGALLTGEPTPTAGTEAKARPAPPAHQPGERRGGPGPNTERFGMPAGFAHSERGARAAAIAYATASQDWLYLSDEEVERSVRAMATETAGAALSADIVAEVRAAREALARSPGRVWWLVRPLASRVERLEPTSARVVVWTMTMLSAADVALPQADWARVSVELVWAGGAWRAQSIAEVPGPTPMVGTKDRPWQPEPFDEALGGFERIASEGRHR